MGVAILNLSRKNLVACISWGNGNRTKEIELMELGLTCSKFLKRSCEIELISYILKQELELICYVKLELKTGIRTNLLRELELKKWE